MDTKPTECLAHTERTRKIEELRRIAVRARQFLNSMRFFKGSRGFAALRDSLDPPSYMAAVAGALQSFNFPEINISPKASANPDQRYEGNLPLYGAALVSIKVPMLIKRLKKIGEGRIHIDESCEMLDEYSQIAIAHLTYGLPRAMDAAVGMHHSIISTRGGSRKTYDLALQKFIDCLYRIARISKNAPTLPDILAPLSGYSFESPMDPARKCTDLDDLAFPMDDIFIGNKTLYWKNRKGEDSDIKIKNLYPYFDRAKSGYSA